MSKQCTCLEQVQDKLAEDDFELDTAFQINFDSGKSRLLPILAVNCLRKSRRKKPTIVCTYCPVCGNRLDDRFDDGTPRGLFDVVFYFDPQIRSSS